MSSLAGVSVGDMLIITSHRGAVTRDEVTSVRRKYLATTAGREYVIATGEIRHGYGASRAETVEQHAARHERLEVQRDLGCRGVETLRARLTTDQLKRILAIAQEETA